MTGKSVAIIFLVFTAGGCAAGGKPVKQFILERNLVEISVQEQKACPRVKLYRSHDGSLWIGDPSNPAT